MTAEEARKLTDEVNHTGEKKYNMDPVYETIEFYIKDAVERGEYSCVCHIDGRDKPWDQIYRERELIKEHFEELGYFVECLGYTRACMWDSYSINW